MPEVNKTQGTAPVGVETKTRKTIVTSEKPDGTVTRRTKIVRREEAANATALREAAAARKLAVSQVASEPVKAEKGLNDESSRIVESVKLGYAPQLEAIKPHLDKLSDEEVGMLVKQLNRSSNDFNGLVYSTRDYLNKLKENLSHSGGLTSYFLPLIKSSEVVSEKAIKGQVDKEEIATLNQAMSKALLDDGKSMNPCPDNASNEEVLKWLSSNLAHIYGKHKPLQTVTRYINEGITRIPDVKRQEDVLHLLIYTDELDRYLGLQKGVPEEAAANINRLTNGVIPRVVESFNERYNAKIKFEQFPVEGTTQAKYAWINRLLWNIAEEENISTKCNSGREEEPNTQVTEEIIKSKPAGFFRGLECLVNGSSYMTNKQLGALVKEAVKAEIKTAA